jgi:hypothetical protein
MVEFPSKYFDDPDEEQLDILGKAYVEPFLNGRRARPIFVLTNRRLYQFGSLVHRGLLRAFRWRRGQTSVDLSDIVEVHYKEFPLRHRVVLAAVLTVAGPIGLAVGGLLGNWLIIGLGSAALGLGMLMGALYYIGRGIIFVVQLKEGFLATRLEWYRRGDVKAFQRGIWAKIDAMKPIEPPPPLQGSNEWAGATPF